MSSRSKGMPSQPSSTFVELFGAENAQELLMIEHDTTLSCVRAQQPRVEALLKLQNGNCLFKKCMNDIVYQVLISDILSPGNLVVCINKIRLPDETEDEALGSHMISMSDVILPKKVLYSQLGMKL